jgi:3-oxoadipate enol-lactonase
MSLVVADAPTIAVHRTGSGPPAVLLHCLGVDHRFWDFAAGLADAFTLLTYDLPGHGATPVPAGPYDIADLSKQLAGLFRRHDLAHAHVVGISLGGLVAQHFAATWPGLVDRLVLIDTTPRYTDELRRMWVERAATARTAGVAALVDGLLNIWFTPEFVAANGPAVRYVRTALARTSGEGYALACEALGAADLRPLARQIAAPTLVLCGADDIASFLDAARWLTENIRGTRLAWLPGARHASVLEKPDEAVALMREFLRGTE